MQKILGCLLIWLAVAVGTLAQAETIHCPMPKDCNTGVTMNTWYACKARQLQGNHTGSISAVTNQKVAFPT